MRHMSVMKTILTGTVLLGFGTVLAGCMSTATYGTGEAPELSILKGVTTGLTREDKEKIDYDPRAPLVMPPNAALPEPVQHASAADPDWPVEPGSARTKVEDPLGPTSRTDPNYVRRLQPMIGALPADQRPASYDPAKASQYAHVEDLRNRGQAEKFRAAIADAEGYNVKERRYLTDPPEAYSEPAETAPKEFDEIDGGGPGSGFAKLFKWVGGGG